MSMVAEFYLLLAFATHGKDEMRVFFDEEKCLLSQHHQPTGMKFQINDENGATMTTNDDENDFFHARSVILIN